MSPSDRAIGAAVCLAAVARRGDDATYAQLEDTIASLEQAHVLSHAARYAIAWATDQRTPGESPHDQGVDPHADRPG